MMLFFFLLLSSLISLVAFYNFYWKRRNLPPGPTPLPLLGNGLSLARASDIYNLFNQWSKTYGPVHTFWFGETPIVFVTDYKIIEKTFIKDGDNYAGRPMDPFQAFLRKGMKGVILTEGHLWQEQRRFALQTLRDFGFGKNIMQERILDEVSSMLANIKNDIKSGDNEHNITKYIDVAVGSIINAILFGYRFEGEKLPEFYELKQLINNFIKLIGKPFIFVMQKKFEWFQNIPILDKIYFEIKNFRDKIFDFLEHQVKEHIAEIDYNSEPTDFVDAYLRKKAKNDEEGEEHYYSMDQLLATIFDLWLAGQETTSSTLSKGVVYLIQNQDAQKKLHEELDRVVGNNRLVTLEDRPKLHYTLAVVNEIQRLANIVAINVHHTTLTDVEIQGYKIPKGTTIIPHISVVMSDSKAFPDPEKFNPERYLDEKGQLKKVDELVPFSVGKRQCLGESLARMELYLFVANIFNQFKISEVSGKPPEITRNFVGTFATPTFTCVIENRF